MTVTQISWCSRKQKTISRSRTEAEYRTRAAASFEVTRVNLLIKDLGIRIHESPQTFSDNLSALQLTINPKFHRKSKHFELDFITLIKERWLKDNL